MKLSVLVLLLSFAIGFYILAYFQSESKRGGYAMLTGFILLLFSGLLTAGLGLEYRDGYEVVESGTTSDITYVYISLTSLETIAVSLPLIIAGLWGLIVVGLAIRETNQEEAYA